MNSVKRLRNFVIICSFSVNTIDPELEVSDDINPLIHKR